LGEKCGQPYELEELSDSSFTEEHVERPHEQCPTEDTRETEGDQIRSSELKSFEIQNLIKARLPSQESRIGIMKASK
jgi:hypothetical protein